LSSRLVHLPQDLVHRPPRAGPRRRDQRAALVRVHESARVEETRLVLLGDHQESVLIGMNELTRFHGTPENLHLAVPPDGRGIGMPDACALGEGLEARIAHLVHVADYSVNDAANAAQGSMDVAIHLAPIRPDVIRLVQVLDDDDLGPRSIGYKSAILTPGIRVVLGMVRIAWLDDHGNRIANHRTHLGHEIARLLHVKVPPRAILLRDGLPSVVNARSIPALELEQSFVGQSSGLVVVFHLTLQSVGIKG